MLAITMCWSVSATHHLHLVIIPFFCSFYISFIFIYSYICSYHYYVNRHILECSYWVCSQTMLGLVSFFLVLVLVTQINNTWISTMWSLITMSWTDLNVGRTECTVAWCSVDNWQPLTNSKFYVKSLVCEWYVDKLSYAKSTHPENTSLWDTPCQHLIQKAHLPWQPPSLQYACTVLVQQSKDSAFHNGDTPIQLSLPWWSHTPFSVSTLKPPLGIIGAILLKPQVSSIVCTYI